jgi:hypothetical protein
MYSMYGIISDTTVYIIVYVIYYVLYKYYTETADYLLSHHTIIIYSIIYGIGIRYTVYTAVTGVYSIYRTLYVLYCMMYSVL